MIVLESLLVIISYNFSFVETNGVQIWPLSSFSLMKCQSIPICSVLSYWTGLWAMLIVALLSQYSLIDPPLPIVDSFNRDFSYISSQNSLCHRSELFFSTWSSYNLLLFASTIHQISSHKGIIPRSRFCIIYRGCPICIRVGFNL